MLLWDGVCLVHEAFALDKILTLNSEHPDAEFIAHPESNPEILRIASYIGSTSGMINYVKDSTKNKFIVATEAGILHQMQKEVPNKELIPAPAKEDNKCSCSECAFMKLNTLEKLYNCLKTESPEITISEKIRNKSIPPIKRMLEISK